MPVMMRSLLIALAVVVIVVVGILAWAVSVNNQLVVAEQNVNEKWAQVQNVYQRSADLVPNLVETVKGFAAQERRSEEHTSELQSRLHLVCRLLLEKKKKTQSPQRRVHLLIHTQ